MKKRLAAAGLAGALLVPVATTTGPATVAAGGSAAGPEVHTHAADIGTAPQTWSASDYDGAALTTDAPDVTDLPQVHAVYVHAADRPSEFTTWAPAFQAEHRRASQFLTQALGMAFRWDKRVSADQRELDDITVVRSRYSYAKLAGPSQFSYVGDALRAAGLTDPDKKYYVWLDADSANCGEGQSTTDARRAADNAAQRSTYAVSYRVGSPYEAIGGWCNPVLHELMHGLGAVPTHAPHYYGGGHCDDDANDVMCVISASPGGAIDRARSRTLDTGNDDYLDPAADLQDTTGATLSYWTVNLSRFLCPRSAADRAVPDCGLANAPAGLTPAPSASPTAKGGGRK